MYYLRTMAASAPIQFTVDQAALQQVDTNVATKPVKKRAARPVPAPMMEEKIPRNGSEESSADELVEKLTVVGDTVASPKKVSRKREEMDDTERGIYDEKVIACSIENPEACAMCSA
jgi:ribonucleoside-diphosphate reductase subunit M1